MTNNFGRAAKFAYNPQVFLTYVEHLTTYENVRRSVVRKDKKTYEQSFRVRMLNGTQLERDKDARMLRRWGKGALVTKSAAERFFGNYNLTTDGFETWAKRRKLKPIARGGK